MIQIYKKRIRQFFFASVGFLSLVFFSSLVLYPYFKLPLPTKLILYTNVIVVFVGVICIPLGISLKKKSFPVFSHNDPYWNYTATRRYFWLFALVNIPFLVAFIVYILFAPLSTLILGYLISLCGLILLRPREEDIV